MVAPPGVTMNLLLEIYPSVAGGQVHPLYGSSSVHPTPPIFPGNALVGADVSKNPCGLHADIVTDAVAVALLFIVMLVFVTMD